VELENSKYSAHGAINHVVSWRHINDKLMVVKTRQRSLIQAFVVKFPFRWDWQYQDMYLETKFFQDSRKIELYIRACPNSQNRRVGDE